MLLRIATAVLALCAAGAPALADTRLSLDGAWRFKIDGAGDGEARGWARSLPGGTELVDVPHTWGIGPHAEHEGLAWYWRELQVPAPLRGRRLELEFGATFYRARVFVNGRLVGAHEGGHTAWWLDVTRALGSGGRIAVEIDNRPGLATLPGWAMRLERGGNVWYDWWHYGGIVQGVSLVARERAFIRRQAIRALLPPFGPGREPKSATVTTRVALEGEGRVRLEARVLDPGGEPVAEGQTRLTLAGRAQQATLRFAVARPHLWHFDDPALYRLELRLRDGRGNLLGQRSDNFGIRSVEIRERGLWLNGERVRLTGLTRHEDSVQEGLAETRGTILADWDDLKRLQVVLTRPVHYPQHPAVFDYADRHGVLLVPEIPMWQFSEAQMADPSVLALAKRMMREMIDQAGNHPSIFAWSVCNESATNSAAGRAYVKAMVEQVKSLDPTRYVSYADDGLLRLEDPAANANQYTDFVMMNQYFGSWAGPAEGLSPALDRLGRMFPDKMVLISEFGLAGIFAPDPARADVERIRILRDQMAEFARHDFVAGAIFWCYQDYKSHRNLRPGETSGFVEMGLVDQARQRRPSYQVFRERTSPAHLSLVLTRRDGYRPDGFRATIARRGPEELPSYELRGYRVEWEARDQEGELVARGARELPVIGPPQTIEGSWSAASRRALTLRVRLVRPTGFVAAEKEEHWWEGRSGGLDVDQARRRGLAAP